MAKRRKPRKARFDDDFEPEEICPSKEDWELIKERAGLKRAARRRPQARKSGPHSHRGRPGRQNPGV